MNEVDRSVGLLSPIQQAPNPPVPRADQRTSLDEWAAIERSNVNDRPTLERVAARRGLHAVFVPIGGYYAVSTATTTR
jgi:hypothetical protein